MVTGDLLKQQMVGTLTISTVYLDWAAAAPPNRQALRLWQAMSRDYFANPNSLHNLGREAQGTLDHWRNRLAERMAVKPHQLLFPPGATAANKLVADLAQKEGVRLVCLAADHDSIRQLADRQLEVSPQTGTIDWSDLKLDDDVGILSLSGVNNETGICQPWSQVKAALKRIRDDRQQRNCSRPLWLHVDGSQMTTTANCQPQALAADLMTINGVKCGAPKRTGCLFVAGGLPLGGSGIDFERGTESLANVASLALSVIQAQNRSDSLRRRLGRLQASFESDLISLGGQIVGAESERSPHITGCYFRGVDGERLALAMSRRGFAVGVGSACRGLGDDSSTLQALGLSDDQIRGSLRFSFGWSTKAKDLQRAVKALAAIMATSGPTKN